MRFNINSKIPIRRLCAGSLLALTCLATPSLGYGAEDGGTPSAKKTNKFKGSEQLEELLGALQPIASPLDPKIVTFPYSPAYIYPIYTHAGIMTDIEFAEGEKVTGVYLSDKVRWTFKVTADRADVMIAPQFDGLTNAATIKTTLRKYQLTFLSRAEPAKYYQQVGWKDSQEDFYEMPQEEELKTKSGKPKSKISAGSDNAPTNGKSDFSKLNFEYEIKGDKAPFRPIRVFDDGRFTWIQFAPDMDELPGIFIMRDDGQAELGNIVADPDHNMYVVRETLNRGALLKLGDQTVEIVNKRNCGWFSCSHSASNVGVGG